MRGAGAVYNQMRLYLFLRRGLRLLQYLMENMTDNIYFKDAASRFTRINQAQARTLGVDDPQEALGKTDFDFFAAEIAQDAYLDEQGIVKSGRRLVDKVEGIREANGQTRWFSTTKVPITDEGEHVTGIVGISRDITARKRAELALQKAKETGEKLASGEQAIILQRIGMRLSRFVRRLKEKES